jgi:3-hydroxyisobutyrate dehydrogenase-like beta-hydroxyacid dehydrogenase
MSKDTKIGFIGLGTMGGRIGGRFADNDYGMHVFDISKEALNVFVEKHAGAVAADSVQEVFESSDVVFLSLPGSPQVEAAVAEAEGGMIEGKIIVDLSTSQPDSTRRLADKLGERNCTMMEAPLTGGPPQAESGELTVIAAGDEAVYGKIRPLLEEFGKNIFFVGGSGSGHTIKLINNSLSGLYVCLYAEILPLLERLGIDRDGFMSVIGASGGNSTMFPIFAPKMLNRDFSLAFAIELMEKDFSYVEKILAGADMKSGILAAGRALCLRALDQGRGKDDVSSLIDVNSS